MKQKKYSSNYYIALRMEQIRLLEQSISWRQKNIKYQSKRKKDSILSA